MSQARRPARRRLGLAMTPFALLAALDGCAGRPSARNSPLTDSARLAIYERAGAGYTNVLFFKPLDAGPADAMGFAPLILQETDADERRPMGVSSAELSASNTIPSLPGPAPTIYFQGSQTLIHGRRHNQVIYLWRHPDWTPRLSGAGSSIQALRITLDAAGQPALWEIARDTSRAEIIFVSHAIERAAGVEYGGPLPGRRFSVECEAREAPRTVVGGIVDNTPLPTGPMIYLRAGTRDIGAITCRCDPAPTRIFVGQSYYALTNAIDGTMSERIASERRCDSDTGFWREERPGEAGRLERCLRLPRSF